MAVDWNLILKTRREVLARYPSHPPLGLDARQRTQDVGAQGRELLVLTSAYSKPFASVDSRAASLGLSPSMVRRLLAQLEAKGWLQLVSFSLRTRGYMRLPNITTEGLQACRLVMPEEGSGSFLHRHFQMALRDTFRNAGHDSRIEFTLRDKRVDVAFLAGGNWVAVECGLSSAQNECGNIFKDFRAGFREVRALLRDAMMRDAVINHLATIKDKSGRILRIELLTDYLNASQSTLENDPERATEELTE